MRMKIKRALVSALCLTLCLCLCGCVAGVDALNKTSSVTLPPAQVEYDAPTGDTNQETAQSVLLYVPSWVQVRLRIELPPPLEITILCFIFAAEILGEVNAFYVNVPHWDTMLHTINGFLAAAVGFSLVLLLNDNEKLTFDLSPFFLAMVAFCFSMTIGVLWEFFEFGMDWFFHTDMQRDTVINAIYSASLDPTRTNKVVAVKEIHDVVINGENLGLGGYLDIGLIDTMKDLLVNFVGAVVFSVAGYFYARSKGKKRAAALNFVPSKKNEDHDYLQQARENGPDLPEKRKK